jgi:hypothetical protein
VEAGIAGGLFPEIPKRGSPALTRAFNLRQSLILARKALPETIGGAFVIAERA